MITPNADEGPAAEACGAPTPSPYVAELIPLNQGWLTSWLVSCEADQDPDDYHAGWIRVRADGRQRLVELESGEVLSPVEARNLAAALIEAARHAESYAVTVSSVLGDEEMRVRSDLGDAPIETHQAVHGWFRMAIRRAHFHIAVCNNWSAEVSG
jgi:hypothetical protein